MHTSLFPANCTIGFNAPSCFSWKEDPFRFGVQTEYVNLRSSLYNKPERNPPSPDVWTVHVKQYYVILYFCYSFNTNLIILYIFELKLRCINILPFIYDNVYSTLYCYVLKTFSPLRMAVVHSRSM